MLSLNISQEQVDKATSDVMSKMLNPEEYNNPIKRILEQQFSWDMSGEGKTDLAKDFKIKVQESMVALMNSPDFHTKLGAIIIDKFAEACVKDIRTLKDKERR